MQMHMTRFQVMVPVPNQKPPKKDFKHLLLCTYIYDIQLCLTGFTSSKNILIRGIKFVLLVLVQKVLLAKLSKSYNILCNINLTYFRQNHDLDDLQPHDLYFCTKTNILVKHSIFAYSMSYIF